VQSAIAATPVGGNVVRLQKFTASGTYTPHANMVSCVIECWGGGGSGGGCAARRILVLAAAAAGR
jgi:hypothetical protein